MRLSVFFFVLISNAMWSQDFVVTVESDSSALETKSDKRVVQMVPTNRIIPIESYFRDRILTSSYLFNPVFPLDNTTCHFNEFTADAKKRYSTFGYYLYNKEIITLKEDNNHLWITPLLDISIGKSLVQDTLNRISQNTRGVRMEGTFNDRFLFSTSFFENQAILPDYAALYALSKGEFYPNTGNGTYYQTNAVLSGAARTKPFETNGFDYAYAVGFVSMKLGDKMKLSFGNNSLFVGSGYRSMLFSDHSLGAMNARFQWNLSNRWSFETVRMRGMNLLRRLGSTNVEAYYEPTLISMSTIYFRLNRACTFGLFEAGVWDHGDSLLKRAVSPMYYIPLPGVSTIAEASNSKSNTVLGLDGNYRLKHALIYGQFALNPLVERSSLAQVGIRLFYGTQNGSWLQVEYNQAEKNAYTSGNPRMNYASSNLPLAHPAGTNFQELLFRANYERNHWFASASFHYYPKQMEQSTLLPIYQVQNTTAKKVLLTVVEMGYRFNRTYGLEAFTQFRYRKSEGTAVAENSWFSIGMRTAIRNHYYDY